MHAWLKKRIGVICLEHELMQFSFYFEEWDIQMICITPKINITINIKIKAIGSLEVLYGWVHLYYTSDIL